MRSIFRYFLLLLTAGVFSVVAVHADQVGAGSYTRSPVPGKPLPQTTVYTTNNVQGPLPSNEWWSSLLVSTPTGHRVYAYPLCYRCDTSGLVMGYPKVITEADRASYGKDGEGDIAPFRQQLLVQGTYDRNGATAVISTDTARVDGYGDWSVRLLWADGADPAKRFTTTIGQGFLFTYFDFSAGVNAKIVFPLAWDGATNGQFDLFNEYGFIVDWYRPVTTDRLVLRFLNYNTGATVYYGLFAPEGTVFNLVDMGHSVTVTFPSDDQRYLSIGLMNDRAPAQLDEYYRRYAYAFVKDTTAGWTVGQADGKVTASFRMQCEARRFGQSEALFALFPHQWQGETTAALTGNSFATLRGEMKTAGGTGFDVRYDYRGILPSFPDVNTCDKARLRGFLRQDKGKALTATDTYFHGKELCRLANLIPIAHQLGETAIKNELIARLKCDLANWYTYTPGETNRFFYYDRQWGGLIGYDTGGYGTENFTDQHLHFGYFVYASAILAMYDAEFRERYGGMVELLIRSYANPDRPSGSGASAGAAMFPFLRTFSPYEGHSWCDGRGTAWDGNNQESSSEAMNAWAAIYLWGLATENRGWRDLGIWGYTTEYESIKRYYFNNMSDPVKIYGSGYAHSTVGVLWGGMAQNWVWFIPQGWTAASPEWVYGIQVLPLNPSMLYPGYDAAFAQANYAKMTAENGGAEKLDKWRDIFWRYRALFGDPQALADWAAAPESYVYDEASSRTFTYYWLHTFNALGKVDTSVYADAPSYGVFNNNGARTYVATNFSGDDATVRYYDRSGGAASLLGTLSLPPYSIASSTDLVHVKVERFLSEVRGFCAVATGLHSVTLSWCGSGRFTIERSTDNVTWTTLAAGYGRNLYIDRGLRYGTTYYYSVKQYSAAGRLIAVSTASARTWELPPCVIRLLPSDVERLLTLSVNVLLRLAASCVPSECYLVFSSGGYGAPAVNAAGARMPAGRLPVNGAVDTLELFDAYGSSVTLSAPALVTLHYPDADGDGIVDGSPVKAKVEDLRAFVYNEGTNTWEQAKGEQSVDRSARTITLQLSRITSCSLMSISPAARNLSGLRVYPNPYKPNGEQRFGNTAFGKGIVFDRLTRKSRIRIYTVAGELVADRTNDTGDGLFLWDVKNDGGDEVASGVYLYMITNPDTDEKVKGKLAIVK